VVDGLYTKKWKCYVVMQFIAEALSLLDKARVKAEYMEKLLQGLHKHKTISSSIPTYTYYWHINTGKLNLL
jgi:hypothetical protein